MVAVVGLLRNESSNVMSLSFSLSLCLQYAGVKIGPVVRKDVMKASVMLEHEEKYTIILAFDVKVERDAQEMADSMGVKIFQADIIYHLFDRFMEYQEELKKRKREEFKHLAIFPCKIRMLPNFIFNSRDPIVAGVVIEAGIVRQGTPICVPSKEVIGMQGAHNERPQNRTCCHFASKVRASDVLRRTAASPVEHFLKFIL